MQKRKYWMAGARLAVVAIVATLLAMVTPAAQSAPTDAATKSVSPTIPFGLLGIPCTSSVTACLPSVPSLNPLHYINDDLKDLMNGMFKTYQGDIVHSKPQSLGDVGTYLNKNVLGLSGFLASIVLLVLGLWSLVRHHKIVNLLDQVIVSLVIAFLGPFWLLFWNGVELMGYHISLVVAQIHPVEKFDFDPTIKNLLGSILGIGFPLLSGGALLVIVKTFLLLALLIKTFGLILLAMKNLSEKTERWWEWALSTLITVELFTVPVAALAFTVAAVLVDHEAKGANGKIDVLTACIDMFVAFLLGIAAEFGLLTVIHKAVVRLRGRTNVKAVVTGKVKNQPEKNKNVDQRTQADIRAQSMRPQEVIIVGDKRPRRAANQERDRARREGAQAYNAARTSPSTSSTAPKKPRPSTTT